MKVIGYVRVSTEEQATTGVSLAHQTEKIRAYAVSLAKESEGLIVDVGLTIDRAVVVALLLAYFDAVREGAR